MKASLIMYDFFKKHTQAVLIWYCETPHSEILVHHVKYRDINITRYLAIFSVFMAFKHARGNFYRALPCCNTELSSQPRYALSNRL